MVRGQIGLNYLYASNSSVDVSTASDDSTTTTTKTTAATTTSSPLNEVSYITKLLHAGQGQNAVECQKALQRHSTSTQLAGLMGDAHATNKNYTAALQAYERAHELLVQTNDKNGKLVPKKPRMDGRLSSTIR